MHEEQIIVVASTLCRTMTAHKTCAEIPAYPDCDKGPRRKRTRQRQLCGGIACEHAAAKADGRAYTFEYSHGAASGTEQDARPPIPQLRVRISPQNICLPLWAKID
eukprot:6550409-Prymnesium_polylepis.2